jgi:hypothetical protein
VQYLDMLLEAGSTSCCFGSDIVKSLRRSISSSGKNCLLITTAATPIVSCEKKKQMLLYKTNIQSLSSILSIAVAQPQNACSSSQICKRKRSLKILCAITPFSSAAILGKPKRARSKFQILEQKTNTLKRHCTETDREIDRDKEICLYFDSSFSKARRKVRCNVCGRKYLPFSSRIRSISASPAHASATVFIVKQVRGNPACSTTVTTRCCCSRHSYPP